MTDIYKKAVFKKTPDKTILFSFLFLQFLMGNLPLKFFSKFVKNILRLILFVLDL